MPVAAKQNRTLEILLTAKDLTKRPLQQVKQEVLRTGTILRRSFTGATAAARGFSQQLFNLRNVVVAGVGAAMTKFAADFEDQLAQVAGLIDDPRFDLSRFSAGVRDVAIETGDSFSSLTKSLFDTVSAGVDASQALDVLRKSARLAAAGGTDTATAVDGVTSILNAYGLAATDAARVTDALFAAQKKGKTTIAELSSSIGQVAPLAAQLGVSLEEVTGALAALTTAGLSTEEAATQVKGFFAALVKPGADARAAARELGIEFGSSAVEGGRFLEFLRELEKATGGSTEQLARLFPNVRALQGVLGLAKNDARTFADVLDAMANKAGSVDRAFEKTNRTLGAQIRRTWRSIQSSIVDVIEGLRPVIEQLLGSVRGFFTRLAESREQVVGLFRSLAELLLRLRDAIAETFRSGDAIQLFVNGLTAAVQGIGEVFVAALPAIVGALKLLGRSAAVAFVRQFFGSTKEEIVRKSRDGFIGKQIAKSLLGGSENVELLDEQLRLYDRLREVRENRQKLLAENNLLDEKGLVDLERIQAKRQGLLLKINAETTKLARLEIPDQDFYMDRTQDAIRQTKAQIEDLKEQRAQLKLLAMSDEDLARNASRYSATFAGSPIGSDVLKADQEQLSKRLAGLVDAVPAIRDRVAETLTRGLSEGARDAFDRVGAAGLGVGQALEALRDAMGKAGVGIGKALGEGFGKGIASIRGAVAASSVDIGKEAAGASEALRELAALQEKVAQPVEVKPAGWLKGATAAIRTYIAEVRDSYAEAMGVVSGAALSAESALAGAFVAMSNRAKDLADAIDQMARSILASIQQLLAQALARQILSGIFGALFGGSSIGGTAGSATGSVGDQIGQPLVVGNPLGSGLEMGGMQGPQGGGEGSGQTVYHIEHHYHVSAIDGRSVQRFFEENQGLIAAQNIEVMKNSPVYRRELRKAAR